MRKTLEDFNYDYQAYANYLESAECANDEDYDIYADEKGNVYERTDGDWTKGHGHKNTENGYNRDKDDEKSKGRPWKNPWLLYNEQIILNKNEIQLLESIYGTEIFESKENKKLTRKR